jgi:hypothetical protein
MNLTLANVKLLSPNRRYIIYAGLFAAAAGLVVGVAGAASAKSSAKRNSNITLVSLSAVGAAAVVAFAYIQTKDIPSPQSFGVMPPAGPPL